MEDFEGQDNSDQEQEIDNSNEGFDNDPGNESEGSFNPAWNPMLEKLPTEFHSQIADNLKEWDGNFQKVQSAFSPYKQFADNNIPADALQRSFELAQAIQADPEDFYRELGRRFGFANQGEEDQGQYEDDDEEDDDDGYFASDDDDDDDDEEYEEEDIFQHPAFLQIQEEMEELRAEKEEREEARLEYQVNSQIESEFAEIEQQAGGPIPDNIREDIIQRALSISERNGEEPSLIAGYKQFQEFSSAIRNSSANNTAPQVFGGNGRVPVQKVDLTSDDSEKRIQDIAKLMEQKLGKIQ